MIRFLFSRHRKLYWTLGLKYHVWPDRVYRLAHGKHAHGSRDKKILHALLAEGIIHRRKNTHQDEDETIVFAPD